MKQAVRREDPLICEGFQKMLVFGITRLSIRGGDLATGWLAGILWAVSFGIFIAKPYGSRSRNELAAACYAALGFTSLLFFMVDLEELRPPKWMIYLPSLVLAFYFAHLQLMPGDVTLQAAPLRQKMEKTLSTSSGEFTLEVEEILWSLDWPGQTLLQRYRKFVNEAHRLRRSGTIWARGSS